MVRIVLLIFVHHTMSLNRDILKQIQTSVQHIYLRTYFLWDLTYNSIYYIPKQPDRDVCLKKSICYIV